MMATLNAFCHLAFLMAAAHALADRPLQEGSIRAEKYAPRGEPGAVWVYGITCHALIHGGLVALITGHWWLGALESIAHASIDEAKCRGLIGLKIDQLLHFACKAMWAGIAVALS